MRFGRSVEILSLDTFSFLWLHWDWCQPLRKLTSTYQSTRCYIPNGGNLQQHRCKNRKFEVLSSIKLKVKLKLFLCSTSTLGGSEWKISRAGPLYPRGRSPWYPINRRFHSNRKLQGLKHSEKKRHLLEIFFDNFKVPNLLNKFREK